MRFSLGRFSSEDDVAYALRAMSEIAAASR